MSVDRHWSSLGIDSNGEHTINGTACSIRGSGKVVVLIHGVGLDRTLWAQHAADLSRDYCVVCYDMPGHGNSDPAAHEATIDDFAEQLLHLLDDLGVACAAIAGFSLGALVTQAFITRYPQRIARMALLYSVYKRSEAALSAINQRIRQAECEGTQSLINAALARWFSSAFLRENPAIEAEIRQRLTNNNPAHFLLAYKLFASTDIAMQGVVDAEKVPTLVMTGEYDSGSTPAMSQAIADDIPGSTLVILKNLRHMGVVEAVDETLYHLRAWLSN